REKLEVGGQVAVPRPEHPLDFATPPDEDPVSVSSDPPPGPTTTLPPRPVAPPTPLTYTPLRSPNEFYPPAAIRLDEHGVAVVFACVGPDGRLQGTPAIRRSTGSPRLDGAAVRWASEALRFQPATRDGAAVAACQGFRVVFDLR